MQTFLPFADFVRSAEALDDRRLGKQRVETLQILRALHLEDYGWANHPAVTMWRGHTAALVAYGTAVVDVWLARGRADTTRANIVEFVHPAPPATQQALADAGATPPWLGDDDVHRSHRSALVRKDPDFYGPTFPDTPPDLPYVWPEPPAPPPPRGRRTATVVRGAADAGRLVLPAEPDEPPADALDATGPGRGARGRALRRLADGARSGDLVAVPEDGGLRVGVVVGRYRRSDAGHVLPVRWVGSTPRGALRFPAALQHPREVFVLRDEPAIAALAAPRRSTDGPG